MSRKAPAGKKPMLETERLETCTPSWKNSRPVLPCLADREW
jgi:hypothetical protein